MSALTKEELLQKSQEYAKEHYHVFFETEEFGCLEFRQVIPKDFSTIEKLLKDSVDSATFVKNICYNLIVNPKISQDEFSSISDKELISIVRQIVEKNEIIKKLFYDPKDDLVFSNFHSALKKYREKRIEELTKTINALVLPHITTVNKILNSILPQMEIIQNWIDQNQKLFANFFRAYQILEDSLKRYHTTIEEANKILKKYKWFVSLSLPDSFYGAILEIESTGKNKKKKINKLFIDYFSGNNFKYLEELVESWKSHSRFKSRMRIFRACIQTLQRAKKGDNPSNVIIPALIAQIDGIINDIVDSYGIQYDKKSRMWIDGKGNQSKKKDEAKKKLIQSLNEYSPIGEYLLLEILFQEAYRGQKLSIPTTFSRHKILHGEYVHYGRKDNTIKAFLILDFLHYLEGV